MIELGKQYRTRDGRKVRIYAVDCGGHRPVHGAIRENNEWVAYTWLHDGVAGLHCNTLIEVKPRIQREVWVNVYRWGISGCYETKESADNGEAEGARIACVKAVLDFEEGEGL